MTSDQPGGFPDAAASGAKVRGAPDATCDRPAPPFLDDGLDAGVVFAGAQRVEPFADCAARFGPRCLGVHPPGHFAGVVDGFVEGRFADGRAGFPFRHGLRLPGDRRSLPLVLPRNPLHMLRHAPHRRPIFGDGAGLLLDPVVDVRPMLPL